MNVLKLSADVWLSSGFDNGLVAVTPSQKPETKVDLNGTRQSELIRVDIIGPVYYPHLSEKNKGKSERVLWNKMY